MPAPALIGQLICYSDAMLGAARIVGEETELYCNILRIKFMSTFKDVGNKRKKLGKKKMRERKK